ncbi:hypothetical protein O6H91_09G042400 [Diphasiastrum complanatum]|uniref:Uncharacterized protein n=1 Tax=Diphasiastrum complanatum TaxID=34168 RepID=A0ACC2CNR8_DIPCM|nr:hypothetical protein O6H91_09G042400 [Diphasiastrum complanatum]
MGLVQRNNETGCLADETLPASSKMRFSDEDHAWLYRKKRKRDKKSHIKGIIRESAPPLGREEADSRVLVAGHDKFGSWNGCPDVNDSDSSQDLRKVARVNGSIKHHVRTSAEVFGSAHIDDRRIKSSLSLRVESDQLPELDAISTQNDMAVVSTEEKLLKGDKVWQYVCKRAVLVAPPIDQFSPMCKITKDSNFQHLATGNVKRTIRTSLPVYGKKILVTVTCEAAVAQEWLERQTGELFGLDVEWRPNRGKGVDNKVALLQLSGDKECLMLQMLFMDSIPRALVTFLLDSEKKMAGVGVKEDASKLLRDYGLACNGLVELTALAVQQLGRPECKHMGLKALAQEVIGIKMQKLKRVTLSDWAKPILDNSQVLYACVDAWVSFAVFHKLQVANS